MLLFAWATTAAPNLYGHVLFSAHMVQHMMLAMVVPLLLVLAAPVTLALRALPVRSTLLRSDDSRGPREWILVLVAQPGRHVPRQPAGRGRELHRLDGALLLLRRCSSGRCAATSGTSRWSCTSRSPGTCSSTRSSASTPARAGRAYPQRLLLLFATMAFHAFFGVRS